MADGFPGIGHNGGPPLEHEPEWGPNGPGRFFTWKKARGAAWSQPREIALRRLAMAEAVGLTYEEYTLEILERGRFLRENDCERVAAVKARRR